jgi:hypothetical protein
MRVSNLCDRYMADGMAVRALFWNRAGKDPQGRLASSVPLLTFLQVVVEGSLQGSPIDALGALTFGHTVPWPVNQVVSGE